MNKVCILDVLNEEYFKWLTHDICETNAPKNRSYNKLLRYLFNYEFVPTITMDVNRCLDGTHLRTVFQNDILIPNDYYRKTLLWGYDEMDISKVVLGDNFLYRSCSMLEMMIALASRCETQFMKDEDQGDRTSQWFWEMIASLELGHMTDSDISESEVDTIMDNFINHRYSPTGVGGLFTIEDCPYDLRNVEIWYQMCWHIDRIL